jgi:ABC-type glycerol-3-phosphate transport system substrate-binding protein
LIDFMRDEINTFPHPKYRLPAKKLAQYGEPHVWSMPFMFGTVVLFYRTDLVPKPPTTRDEFIAAAKAATKAPDQWGFATMLKAPEYGIAYIVFPTILEEGGDLFDEKWRPTINTPAVRSMLQFVYDMIWTHKIAPPGMPAYGRTESIGLFMDGKAAMTQEESYRWGALKDPTKSKVADKVGVAVQPNWASTTKHGLGITGGSWGWGVNAYSRHKPEAIKLVKWLSSREANIRLWQKTGTGVPRKSAEAELLRTDPNDKVIAESIKHYGGYIWSKDRMVNIPEWPELAQKIQAHFVNYWTKQKSMDEVVVAAEKEAYEILRKAGYYE